MNINKITLLGTGTSTGIPLVGCDCEVCLSNDPKNKRLRTSSFIETSKGKKILIDTSPDLRYQALRNNINEVDSVIITHSHADHTHGIDDLRPFCFAHKPQKTIPIYTSPETKEEMTDRFPYIFQAHKIFTNDKPILGGGIPTVELYEVPLGEEFIIDGEKFIFFQLPHGHVNTLCFIHEKLGYIVDCKEIPNHIVQYFAKAELDVLIIECLRDRLHSTHLHTEDTLKYIDLIRPKFAGLVHMAHEHEHQKLTKRLKKTYNSSVLPLYDNQVLEYSDEK